MSKGDKSVIIKDIELVPYLHMVWENKVMPSGELLYKHQPPGISEEMVFDANDALAHLLASGQVFINNHWWKGEKKYLPQGVDPWPEAACNTFSINANCSDVFCWACADTEEVLFAELQDLYDHYLKDKTWGTAVWCIKKRNEMPQPPVYEAIMKCGIWDLDFMGLQENSSEKFHREQKEKRRE